MKTYRTTGGGTRIKFNPEEVAHFRAFLLILQADASAAEERARQTVRASNGEAGREQANYWASYQKALRHVTHRLGQGVKKEMFIKALAIITTPAGVDDAGGN